MKYKRYICSLLLLLAFNVTAGEKDKDGYRIDSANSFISFATTKKQYIVEPATLSGISGDFKQGVLEASIDLNTINTRVPIRDDRLKQLFFDVANFSNPKIRAVIDDKMLKFRNVKTINNVGFELTLFGQTQELTTNVLVAKVYGKRMLITNIDPIIVDASSFGVPGENIKNLAKTVGSIAISDKVPVNFALVLERL